MTRGGSSDSEDSILSHITVVPRDSPSPPAVAAMSTASRSSIGASSLQSTPPTSLDGSAGEPDASKKGGNRRVSRARSSLSTLTSEHDADMSSAKRKAGRGKKDAGSKPGSRVVSDATLVDDDASGAKSRLRKSLDINMHWDMADEDGDDDGDQDAGGARRRASRRSNVGIGANGAAGVVAAAASSLGKRARDALGSLKDKASGTPGTPGRMTRAQTSQSPPKRAKHESKGRMFPNLKRTIKEEKQEEEIAPAEEPPKPTKAPRIEKVYQKQGLYAGQTRSFNPMVKEGTNKKKQAGKEEIEPFEENSVLPLPMFGAYKRLTVDEVTCFAPYKLPADVLIPLRKEQNPKDWSRLNKNRFIGEAAATWSTKEWKKNDTSYCGCKTRCVDNCINRGMSYECNDKICALGADCGNRPFAQLAWRYKNKNFSRLRQGEKPEANLWGEGVETTRTEGRGFGVRAMRTFEPDQIIVEYCGEIITQEEADRRMNEDYKDKQDYYLMDFHDGMIIDATRGSICRFVNHSCDPNCRVEKWIVNGEPRMALFAGENGIMTGEELTYDYNFEVFSKNSTQQCLCGSPNCRGILGPKPKGPPSKAKQLAGVVKGAIQGVKRKVERFLEGDDERKVAGPKKRVKIGPKEVLNKFRKQISAVSAPTVALPDPVAAQERKAERAKRAAERIAREQAEDGEDSIKTQPSSRRRTISTTISVSDLSRASPKKYRKSAGPASTIRKSLSPAKKMVSVKHRVAGTLKSPAAAPRTASQTPLLKSASSATAEAKSMRQSRLSFGPVGIAFGMSPKKGKIANDADGEEEDASAGLAIPKRSSSLKAGTSGGRPGTAKSLVKGASKVAAAAKIGVQGDKAIRKTIRAVSGAD